MADRNQESQPDKEKSRKWKLAKVIVALDTLLYLLLTALSTFLLMRGHIPPAVFQNVTMWGLASWSASVMGVGVGYGLVNVAQHGVYQFSEAWERK